MKSLIRRSVLAASASVALLAAGPDLAASGFAQSARDGNGPTPFLPIQNEPAAKLIVDPPLPGPLARGAVIIQYRVENFRILPVFGAGAVNVSPRAGHLHVTVDNLPWHWADASDTKTIVVVGLSPGEHTVKIELADPEHRVIAGQTVTFTVPAPAQ
jgi:hypothetical protein